MTQEEKDILLRDLCARLPYDVKVWVKTHHGQIIESDFLTLCNGGGYYSTLSYEGILNDSIVKPYLRPMDSMTEEEFVEYEKANDLDTIDSSETLRKNMEAKSRVRISKWYHGADYLNAHHFDYRGLIPMGLALPAPDGMYNF